MQSYALFFNKQGVSIFLFIHSYEYLMFCFVFDVKHSLFDWVLGTTFSSKDVHLHSKINQT